MADLRIGGSPAPTVTRPLPAARAEAVKAAQRAFFETALGGEMQAASAGPAVAATAAASPIAPVSGVRAAGFDPTAPAPRTPLRPGSLLDIKV